MSHADRDWRRRGKGEKKEKKEKRQNFIQCEYFIFKRNSFNKVLKLYHFFWEGKKLYHLVKNIVVQPITIRKSCISLNNIKIALNLNLMCFFFNFFILRINLKSVSSE